MYDRRRRDEATPRDDAADAEEDATEEADIVVEADFCSSDEDAEAGTTVEDGAE